MDIHRVGVLVFSALVLVAAPSHAQSGVGGWFEANASFVKPATDSTTQVAIFPARGEQFQATHIYTEKNKASFDFGGGIRFRQFGVGLAVTRYSDPEVVATTITVPSPYFFNRAASASGITQNPLTHEETAFHIEARYIANLPHASIAVFAGPSYIKATQELVSNDTFMEFASPVTTSHTVAITGYDSTSTNLHAWGYNVGVDAGYFFSHYVGVGGLVRYSQATVKLPNDIQTSQTGVTTTQDAKVGGINLSGGVRFRF